MHDSCAQFDHHYPPKLWLSNKGIALCALLTAVSDRLTSRRLIARGLGMERQAARSGVVHDRLGFFHFPPWCKRQDKFPQHKVASISVHLIAGSPMTHIEPIVELLIDQRSYGSATENAIRGIFCLLHASVSSDDEME